MINLYEKIQSLLKPIYEITLDEDQSSRDYVVLSALLFVAIPLLVSSVIMGVYLIFGGVLSVNWGEVLVLGVIVGLGLLLVWYQKYTAARYLVVWSLFTFSIWGTWEHGFSFYGVLAYVITLLMVFLIINRRMWLVLMIIILPALVFRFFTSPELYIEMYFWMYIGMMSVVGFLLGLLNYLNDEARTSLIQMDKLKAVQQAGVSVASSLDLQTTTSKILEELHNILPHDSASVLLMREPGEVEIVACSGWENPYEIIGLRFTVPGDNPNTTVIQEGRAHILADAPEEYSSFKQEPHGHILSWLGVPLINKGEIIGMMAIDSKQKDYFSEDHIRVVTSFADHVAVAIENARLFEVTNLAIQQRSTLYRTSQEVIQAGADLESIYKTIHTAASDLMPCEAFVIALLDETEKYIDGAYMIDLGVRDPNVRIPLGEGMAGRIIESGESIIVEDLVNLEGFKGVHFGNEKQVRSLVAVPFYIGEKVIGMLSAQSYTPSAYVQEDLELLQLLAAQAGASIENARLLNQMEYIANTDSLTGLRNRRSFDQTLQKEIARAKRYQYSLSLLIIDIDDFKQFNDLFGHSRGDQHLIQIARLILHSVRDPEIVARIGGEEFSVISPHTTREGAVELAERVRKNIEIAFEVQRIPGGTISIGVASYPQDAETQEDLFNAADLAMFRIKRSGKNQVGVPIETEQG